MVSWLATLQDAYPSIDSMYLSADQAICAGLKVSDRLTGRLVLDLWLAWAA